MSIKKLDSGQYEVDVWPNGRNGKRIRRRFDKKQEAVLFERYVLANANSKEWLAASVDRRTMNDLLETWWEIHGQTLENGIIERRHLLKTIRALGNPAVNRLNKSMIGKHRSQRLESGISAATINRDIYRLSGMFNALIRFEEYKKENPCRGLLPLRQKQPLMIYLTKSEIAKLLEVFTGDYRRLALFCMSTGGRWGESCSIRAEQVMHGRVTFLKTKNGKKRTVPISAELEKEIKIYETGPLFKVNYEQFCKLLKLVKPDIPKQQATHILRHTFGSWFMMNGGNLISLQEILGHASIEQTAAYAHLAPNYLMHAITLNPLRGGINV
ncbi:phage integrase [Pantoea allii]|uniref:phage integrase n=1 Tax=Pantoea allii TaxID=574096 RepID=UPI00156162C9|nr:tyrosine-type recombinase/integrase [Pantoea allii]NQS84042.1 tyrosine-type recombinase/integrase [Pantoea allii]